jgi:hypothetical protein
MFALEKINAKIAHLNIRTEKHGEDDVKAVDLKLEAKLPNTFLAQLSPTLRWSLYDKPVDPDLVEDPDYMPTLRYSKMGPIKWDDQIVGGTLFIHAPVSKKDLAFSADVNSLVLHPEEGGSVFVSFRAQIYPKDDEIGKVAAVLGLNAEITIKPPVSTEDDPE